MQSTADGGSRPVPDPTVLTTDAVNQAISIARAYTDGVVAVLTERLDGIDRATILLNETVTRVPTDVQREVGHLKELTDQRFLHAEALILATEKTSIERAARLRASVDNTQLAISDSAQRERDQREATVAMVAQFVPREVVDALVSDLRRQVVDLSDKVNTLLAKM